MCGWWPALEVGSMVQAMRAEAAFVAGAVSQAVLAGGLDYMDRLGEAVARPHQAGEDATVALLRGLTSDELAQMWTLHALLVSRRAQPRAR